MSLLLLFIEADNWVQRSW